MILPFFEMFPFGFRLTLAHLWEIGGNPEAFAQGRSNLIVFAKLEPIYSVEAIPKSARDAAKHGDPRSHWRGLSYHQSAFTKVPYDREAWPKITNYLNKKKALPH